VDLPDRGARHVRRDHAGKQGGVSRTYLLNFQRGGIPYTKPPWGTLAAVNLKTGTLQFEVPLGFVLDPKD